MSKHWPLVPLGNVLTERQEVPSDDALASGEIPIVAKIGFDDGRIQLRAEGQTKTGMILIRPGDFVVSGINAAKGAIAIYGEENTRPIAATIHYGAYIPQKERIDVSFLWWLLRSCTFRDLLLEYVPGGVKTELKSKRLLPIPVPLPPLPEQRRIVKRIESLAAKIEEAGGLREQAIEEVEVLRSSAVSSLSSLNQWRKKTVGEIVGEDALRNGKSVKASGEYSAVRCLVLSCMRNGRINVQDNKAVPLTLEQARPFLVRKRDVFVMRGNGSKQLCGQAGLAEEEGERIIFPDLFIRVPLPESEVMAEYFVAVWNSWSVRSVIEEKAKTTSGIWKVNQEHISSTLIPVPPLPEQHRIVIYLNGLQTKVDALKKLQAETAAELAALLPSILDRAFKGEL